MSHYSYETLTQMKGQAVKDLWHSMIGKPPGLKNTTGLRNTEEILQAILKAQEDPTFSAKFKGQGIEGQARPTRAFEGQARPTRAPKQMLEVPPDMKDPKPTEKKKPGPKPKGKPLVIPPVVSPVRIGAIESTEIPIVPSDVQKIHVRKLYLGDASYFLNPKTKQLYAVVDGKPGVLCGIWNAEARTVQPS
jgi:hypothetical protein